MFEFLKSKKRKEQERLDKEALAARESMAERIRRHASPAYSIGEHRIIPDDYTLMQNTVYAPTNYTTNCVSSKPPHYDNDTTSHSSCSSSHSSSSYHSGSSSSCSSSSDGGSCSSD